MFRIFRKKEPVRELHVLEYGKLQVWPQKMGFELRFVHSDGRVVTWKPGEGWFDKRGVKEGFVGFPSRLVTFLTVGVTSSWGGKEGPVGPSPYGGYLNSLEIALGVAFPETP